LLPLLLLQRLTLPWLLLHLLMPWPLLHPLMPLLPLLQGLMLLYQLHVQPFLLLDLLLP
jgi:hypothetical protein